MEACAVEISIGCSQRHDLRRESTEQWSVGLVFKAGSALRVQKGNFHMVPPRYLCPAPWGRCRFCVEVGTSAADTAPALVALVNVRHRAGARGGSCVHSPHPGLSFLLCKGREIDRGAHHGVPLAYALV